MDKIRIYTVAQELGVPSQELLAYLEENGQAFPNHLAMIDASTADRARAYFAVPDTDSVETVLSPVATTATPADAAVLDFAPFQVEAPAKAEPQWHEDDDLYAASQEAVAKVEQKVTAAAQAPVRQSLVTSTIATASVAIAPTFVAFATFVFGNPNPRPLLATILSIILTAGAIILGSAVWATQPESAGFSFGDLMLWSWVRREAAERALIENTAVLGFDRFGRFLGNTTASQDEQMRAVRDIAAALDAKSSYTLGHSRRVEKHVRKVAEAMGLSAEEIADLTTAAALHDIGNIQIPDEVLRKTGELTIEERDAIEAHVLLGARMVLKAGNEKVVAGIRHHHERWDGAGYPDGMSGADIPLFARLIGIAEAYDAMTSTRPYRQGFGRDHAIEVLRAESGLQFDGELVEIFVSTLPEPLAIATKFPFVARIQRQIQELQLLFKRMGAVAVSATASTIAIALILGGTVLSPGTSDAPEVAERHRKVTPIDRVLASRLHNEGAYDSAAPLSTVLSPRESALALAELAAEDSALVASADGPNVKVPGNNGAGNNGPGSGNPGNGNGNGPGTANPGPETGSVGAGPTTDHGPVIDGGTSDRGAGNDTTPAATTPTATAPPAYEGPGKSGSAPGRNKDQAPGKSGSAPGHNKSGPPGNSGNAPGLSGGAPGNSGNSNAGGNSGSSNAGGNSGSSNAGGNSANTPASPGGSNAGGNA
ncbi:MAG: translation initiation factor IF-2 N-terminal domain-containing protein, partial [Actinobacteria bacterium]|nr:translation initiation factor IF-2 N-terminal domain-containing protein [Actinomycetota bacterium]